MSFFLGLVCISVTIFLSYHLFSINRLKIVFARNAIVINEFRQLKTDDEKQIYLKRVGICMIKDSADYAIRFLFVSFVYFIPIFIYQWDLAEIMFYSIATAMFFLFFYKYRKIMKNEE
ncbi:hypothetical protein [Undibacterium squillarum]|uniref:SdpI/YhfL family protein n=1 Tax=Undibacterium squillarum TaxID=1131567 RepID=A0ABQ2XVE6_9BURK|nr:hypothetical protein [Undibacterium squillarum]GGX34485.1 hypothetical protein GCM10010946_09620 [Undibacterium squillarum]